MMMTGGNNGLSINLIVPFEHIAIADPEHSIFGASPAETIHALKNGVAEEI
jgi:hypothetical protein